MVSDLFIHEDISKQENRINLAIFSLMVVRPFREWFLRELQLPSDSVLYPPTNVSSDEGGGLRPDFVVKQADSNRTIAWVEVEIWTNLDQLEGYRRTFPEPVKALWGKASYGADLSLEEISAFLTTAHLEGDPQVRFNTVHLKKLIDEALSGGGNATSKKVGVGDAMWDSTLMLALREALGRRLTRFLPGEGDVRAEGIRVDTTDTKDNKGFSVRVYSPWSSQQKSVSVLNRSGGRPEVRFSSKAWLDFYLKKHSAPIRELGELIRRMGGDDDWWAREPERVTGGRPKGNNTVPIPIANAEFHAADIARIVSLLADRPA